MKWILLILLAIMGSLGIAQKQNSSVISRQILLKGSIDKHPVTLRLFQAKEEINGYYYYNNIEEPIEVSGQFTTSGKLKLSVYGWDDIDETFEGILDENGYEGTWTAHGKNLIFRFKPAKDSSLPFDYIYTYGEKGPIKSYNPDKTDVSYEAASVWPASNASNSAVPFIKSLIRKEFTETPSKEDIGPIMLKQKKEALDTTNMVDRDFAYETNIKIQVMFCNKRLLVLSHYIFGDYGGVHGSYSTSFICADLQKQALITLNDVLDSARADSSLKILLEKQFRKQNRLKKEDSLNTVLFKNDFDVTNNIYLTSKGIGFCFDPYEVAAYVYGEIKIFIPYKELDSFLRPGFKKLLAEIK